jgi:hypothetical protein
MNAIFAQAWAVEVVTEQRDHFRGKIDPGLLLVESFYEKNNRSIVYYP